MEFELLRKEMEFNQIETRIGEIKRFVKFLDHISSRKDIVRPNCPLNKMSHSTTADRIILSIPKPVYELFEIKKFVKKPQNKIWTDGQ